jgi:prepilin-type N-terminal cleavage/methylation domain-containing protein
VSRDRQGFSLVEALVALAVAALTLGAIFELQVQMARGQARAAAVLDQVAAQESALVLLRDHNFMVEPAGERALGPGQAVRWQATPIGSPQLNVGLGTGDGLFEVQRFRVRVEIAAAPGRVPPPMEFERVGWRRLTEEP